MAKMSKKIRKAVFENAINKLYGDRLVTEKRDFEKTMEDIVLKMVKRTAKENGADYEALITTYKPYVGTRNSFYYQTDTGHFDEELGHIFFNEHYHVLEFEDVEFDLVREFRERHVYRFQTENSYPYTVDQRFNDSERKEIIAAFKRYAGFMKEVITSACAIRDVINSAATTKQLMETSSELGALIPDNEECTALVPVETVKKVSALFAKR
jgi:hypothetical protein